jgi:hypothetical protein
LNREIFLNFSFESSLSLSLLTLFVCFCSLLGVEAWVLVLVRQIAGGVAQVVKHLPSKCEALRSNSTANK